MIAAAALAVMITPVSTAQTYQEIYDNESKFIGHAHAGNIANAREAEFGTNKEYTFTISEGATGKLSVNVNYRVESIDDQDLPERYGAEPFGDRGDKPLIGPFCPQTAKVDMYLTSSSGFWTREHAAWENSSIGCDAGHLSTDDLGGPIYLESGTYTLEVIARQGIVTEYEFHAIIEHSE